MSQSLLIGIRGKVARGRTIDVSSLEKTMAAALILKPWTAGNLAWFRSAHSTRQQASFVRVFPSTPHLIPLLAVLSFQSSGFSSSVGEVAAPSLPQGALKKGVGVKRRGSSVGLPQHPPLLGSAWWSLREILANSPAHRICWEPQSHYCPSHAAGPSAASGVPGSWWVCCLDAPGIFLYFLAMVCICVCGVCVGGVILRNAVSSSSRFFVAFPIAVTQGSSNMEGDRMSITRAAGSSAVIPCDLPTQNKQYIHWYKFQEGTVPRRLLYYDVSYSKVVLESGISPGKYHGYEGTDKMYKFVISNLQESDSGVYRCAVWEKHIGSALLYTALKFCLSLPKNSPDTQDRPTPASLPAVNANSLYSEQSEILSSSPIPHL